MVQNIWFGTGLFSMLNDGTDALISVLVELSFVSVATAAAE